MKNKNIFLSVSMGLLLSLSAFASELCVGDAVVANMSNGHYDARVLELYNDDTALIQYDVDNTTQVVATSRLAHPIRSEYGFTLGQSVVANMSNGHYDARILELYNDGTALIQYDVDSTTQVVAISRLSQPIGSEEGFTVGQKIVANMSNGHYDARILELYEDETALIQYDVDNTTQVVAISRLSAPIYCEGGCRR